VQDCGTITEWSMDRTSRAEARRRRHAAAEAAGDGGGSPTCVAAPTCQRLPQPSSSCACRGGRPPACPLPGRGAIREPSAAIPSTVAGAAAAKESNAEPPIGISPSPSPSPGSERRQRGGRLHGSAPFPLEGTGGGRRRRRQGLGARAGDRPHAESTVLASRCTPSSHGL